MRPLVSVLAEWMVISILSVLVMAVVYPDLIVSAKIRFTAGHDILIPFQAAFHHAEYFIGEGVAIWNPFDQVNHAYLHLGTGFHTFSAIVEGFIFSMIHGWFDRPGEAFQAFHSIGFILICTLARTAGGIALLNLYPVSLPARIIALLAMNTLLAQQTYVGLMAGFLYSLTPLVLYFIIRFLRRVTWANFFWLVTAFGFAFAQAPLLALGYFYMPIHQFIVCAVIAFALWHWQARRSQGNQGANRDPQTHAVSRLETLALASGLSLVAVIVAANFAYLVLMLDTFSLHGSGLSGSEGRFDKIFDRLDFIKERGMGPDLATAFASWVDFSRNDWWKSWALTGAACLGLSLVGTLCGGHRERWLFVLGFTLAVLVQIQRTYLSFGLPAHYITSLTNPFAFLIRNSHMSTLLIGYFLVPLIAFGVDALRADWVRNSGRGHFLRDGTAVLLLLGAAGYCLAALPLVSGITTSAVFATLAAALVSRRLRPGFGRITAVLPVAILAVDLLGYRVWLSEIDYTADPILPRSFQGLVPAGPPDPNPIVLDFANPASRHFPLFVRTGEDPVSPTTDPEFPTPFAVYFVRQVYMGKFFDTVFMARHLNPLFIYELRHRRYAEVPADPALARLLTGEERLYYFVPVGLNAEKVGIAELLGAKAEGWAVSLEIPAQGPAVGKVFDQLPADPPLYERRESEVARFAFNPAEARIRHRDGFDEYAFDLPADFPAYVATTVFSADALRLSAFLGDRELAPAQGHLIRPLSFDVRNVATNQLVVALSPGRSSAEQIRLEVRLDPLVTAVHPGSDDQINLEISVPEDGWFVSRHPLDQGWSATVNGRSATILAANRTAMAVPVRKGDNTVVLSYASEGRVGLFKSVILAMVPAIPLLGFIVLAAALVLPPPTERRVRSTSEPESAGASVSPGQAM